MYKQLSRSTRTIDVALVEVLLIFSLPLFNVHDRGKGREGKGGKKAATNTSPTSAAVTGLTPTPTPTPTPNPTPIKRPGPSS